MKRRSIRQAAPRFSLVPWLCRTSRLRRYRLEARATWPVGEGGLESSAGILAEALPIQAEVLLERPEGVVLVVDEPDLEGWKPQLYHVSDDEKSEEMSKGQIGKYVSKVALCTGRDRTSPVLRGF